jgi:hypothetical protein
MLTISAARYRMTRLLRECNNPEAAKLAGAEGIEMRQYTQSEIVNEPTENSEPTGQAELPLARAEAREEKSND